MTNNIDAQRWEMAGTLRDWLTNQKCNGEDMMHAAVCCDYAGSQALRRELSRLLTEANWGPLRQPVKLTLEIRHTLEARLMQEQEYLQVYQHAPVNQHGVELAKSAIACLQAILNGQPVAGPVFELSDQPGETDSEGVQRFRANKVVEHLLAAGGIGLNELCRAVSTEENSDDWAQFAQLIGYSVSGWSSLSYVSDEAYDRIQRLLDNAKGESDDR